MATTIFPYHDSDDFSCEIVHSPRSQAATLDARSDAYMYFCTCLLYQQILGAQAGGYPSLVDLPVELLITILVLAASSSRSSARALAIAARWTSEVTRGMRLKNVSIRTFRELQSFNMLVRSPSQASMTVETLWIATNAGHSMEKAIIPNIIRSCSNLTALACQLPALEALCGDADAGGWWLARPFRLTLMDNTRWAGGWWNRILACPLGSGFLHTVTHLHFAHYQHRLETHLPVAQLPNLTHFAIGPPLAQIFFSPQDHDGEIRSFASALDQLSLRLAMAVLVLWPTGERGPRMRKGPQFPPTPWHTRELVQTARDCSAHSNIMIYCASDSHWELKFWDACANAGEDIWTLAEKQMALFP
ncbi:hypothetical protein B0H19DRAFT_296209 [Mycena capillaripes]|nr:hypothetical protein B0H19DRAFT_296209 [Mycena capillaripes]